MTARVAGSPTDALPGNGLGRLSVMSYTLLIRYE